MRILLLSSGSSVPSSRFRMLPYVPRLRSAGHRCRVSTSFPAKYDYFPWLGFRPSQKLKHLTRYAHWWLSRIRRDDVVVIDRELFDDPSTSFEERFRQSAARLVLDLDDAVFLRYPEKFERLVPMADLVICGNRLIEEWVESRNTSTIVIPSCVDLDLYPLRDEPEADEKPLQIGWMGTASNIRCLNLIAPTLRTLASRHTFEFLIVTNDPGPLRQIDLSGVSLQHARWNAESEFDMLNSMDIGVMPLSPESEWDRYKCGMKLIQYMAARLPAVASPIGVNAEILSGDCGFAATSPPEWESQLTQLIENASLRRTIGDAARSKIEAEFSVQSLFPRYEAALRSLFESSETQAESQK